MKERYANHDLGTIDAGIFRLWGWVLTDSSFGVPIYWKTKLEGGLR